MARPRQPVDLIIAKGQKHLTKAEIESRRDNEVKPLTDNIIAPDYLTKKQKEEFNIISNQLQQLKIMSNTDIDALARYIMSKDLYVKLTKQLRKSSILNNPLTLDMYIKNQDKAFKQCRACANDLGLTISSRCKLVVPEVNKEPQEKENKFKKFEKRPENAS